MSAMASVTMETRTARRRRSRRTWTRLAEFVLVAVAVFCLAAFLMQDFGAVFRMFYSPLAVLLLVVVFVEYLIIKGGDRSRLYRIEIDRMHEREQELVSRTRRAVEEVDKALERCRELPPPSDPPALEAAANDVKESLRKIAHELRPDRKD